MCNTYNIIDILLPIFFAINILVKILWEIEEYDMGRLIDNQIQIFIIIASMIKLLQFIRFKEEYAKFVQMFF